MVHPQGDESAAAEAFARHLLGFRHRIWSLHPIGHPMLVLLFHPPQRQPHHQGRCSRVFCHVIILLISRIPGNKQRY